MNYKRKKPKSNGCGTGKILKGSRAGEAPGFWNRLNSTRPKRYDTKLNCKKILSGEDPEKILWSLGNRRPHIYFW